VRCQLGGRQAIGEFHNLVSKIVDKVRGALSLGIEETPEVLTRDISG